MTEINTQIHQLAPILNGPSLEGVLTVTNASEDQNPEDQNIATMCKLSGNTLYLFAVNMRNHAATTTFAIHESVLGAHQTTVQVEGEGRQLEMRDRQFEDEFPGYGVHIYRIMLQEE